MENKCFPCSKCPLTFPTRASLHHHHRSAHLDIYCEICSSFIAATSTGWEKATHMYLKHRIRIPTTSPPDPTPSFPFPFQTKKQETPPLREGGPAPERPDHFPRDKVKFDPERLAAEAVFPEPFTGPNAYTTSYTGSANPKPFHWRNHNARTPPKTRPGTSSGNHSNADDKPPRQPEAHARAHPKIGRPADAPPDHYAVLGVKRFATHAMIVHAAKAKRIECHPDRVKRKKGGLSPEEEKAVDERAKAVGFAAEVLGDRVERKRYEEGIAEWEVRTGWRW